jgi:hypothetical protein
MSGITITDTTMTSPATPHTATTTGGGWQDATPRTTWSQRSGHDARRRPGSRVPADRTCPCGAN